MLEWVDMIPYWLYVHCGESPCWLLSHYSGDYCQVLMDFCQFYAVFMLYYGVLVSYSTLRSRVG
ncbi:hypothetical protein ES703_26849 [subsurface metagenome]